MNFQGRKRFVQFGMLIFLLGGGARVESSPAYEYISSLAINEAYCSFLEVSDGPATKVELSDAVICRIKNFISDDRSIVDEFKVAIESGSEDSIYNLVVYFINRKEYLEARSLIKSRKNDARLIEMEATLLYFDAIVQEGFSYVDLYEKSAQLGNRSAMYKLGIIYTYDGRVTSDWKKSIYWLTVAESNGVKKASYAVASILSEKLRDYPLAYEKFSVAYTNTGDSRALFSMARMIEKGEGIGKNIWKAVSMYQNAAELGSVEAWFNLGMLYLHGDAEGEFPKDYEKSRICFQIAAEKGVADAMYYAGLSWAYGWGGSVSYAIARDYLEKAVESGYSRALPELQRVIEMQESKGGE